MIRQAYALLLAGSFFCCGCAGGCAEGRVKADVLIAGVEVGGLPYREAADLVRESLVRLPLVVQTPAGDFSAPLEYSDNVGELVRTAKRGERLSPDVRRVWIGAEEDLERICAANARESENASLSFSADGFVYGEGKGGIACDYAALLAEVGRALSSGETEVRLVCRDVPPQVTRADLEERTQPLASFRTTFDAANTARAANIAIAASRLSGSVIEAGEYFSFNETVGARTRENGFGEAPVIYDGEFVQGVGGGVCQASTTLFGAALRAGLEIAESHPHSLSVGYVAPSEDAMVSSASDLVLRNPYDTPVYLLGGVEEGAVEFCFYGAPQGIRFEVESVVVEKIEPPPAQVIEGTQNRTVRAPRTGLVSESYLLRYGADGTLLDRTLVRRDVYASVRGIVERVPMPVTPEEILQAEE